MPRTTEPLFQQGHARDRQRDVLIEAIDGYLRWRNNKDAPDNRGYVGGFLTRLRHFTAFGEQRAHRLKENLLAQPYTNPIEVLQAHFANHSRLNNHSLDTYLLENILNHHLFFLIPERVKAQLDQLETKEARAALRDSLMQAEPRSVDELNYLVGKAYQDCPTISDHLQHACHYYSLAVRNNHRAAFRALYELKNAGHSDAQYILGVQFYHRNRHFNEAIDCCLQAAASQHRQAIAYLQQTVFDEQCYLKIAKAYDLGHNIAPHQESAIIFYKKACELNNKEAAFRLGELFEPDWARQPQPMDEGIKEQARRAFNYFLKASAPSDPRPLNAMERIVQQTKDVLLKFKLGRYAYLVEYSDYDAALACFRVVVNEDKTTYLPQLVADSNTMPTIAYALGELYEGYDIHTEDQILVALTYYEKALRHQHSQAFAAILKLLGKVEIDKAILYLDQADISAPNFLRFAKAYDDGKGVEKNIKAACHFYEKASPLRNKEVAFRLGQLFQVALSDREKDAARAFLYYLQAAKLGHADALRPLERLGEEVKADDQLALSRFYESSSIFRNLEKASYWRRKHDEVQDDMAQFSLLMDAP